MDITANTTTIAHPQNGWVSMLTASWRKHVKYRETYEELNGLTDRELADIGIARGQIKQIALEASAAL